MNQIAKLAELFTRFPGIGPRQAKRFVYFLMQQNKEFRHELVEQIRDLDDISKNCDSCKRYFTSSTKHPLCPVCSDQTRDDTLLMVVEKEIDLENIERSGQYDGYYFVLGGVIPSLEREPEKRIRIDDLRHRAENDVMKEIIFALSATPDGDSTVEYCMDSLSETAQERRIKLATLGRGLSTGSELEYSDKETIRNALLNRK